MSQQPTLEEKISVIYDPEILEQTLIYIITNYTARNEREERKLETLATKAYESLEEGDIEEAQTQIDKIGQMIEKHPEVFSDEESSQTGGALSFPVTVGLIGTIGLGTIMTILALVAYVRNKRKILPQQKFSPVRPPGLPPGYVPAQRVNSGEPTPYGRMPPLPINQYDSPMSRKRPSPEELKKLNLEAGIKTSCQECFKKKLQGRKEADINDCKECTRLLERQVEIEGQYGFMPRNVADTAKQIYNYAQTPQGRQQVSQIFGKLPTKP